MIRKLAPLSMLAAALLCNSAFAQETTEAQDTGAEVGSDLDLGQTGPRIGEQYVKEQSGDWNISCIKSEGNEDPCAMVQILDNPQGDPIAEIRSGSYRKVVLPSLGQMLLFRLKHFCRHSWRFRSMALRASCTITTTAFPLGASHSWG